MSRTTPRVSETDFASGRWRARWIWCQAPQMEMEPGAGRFIAPEEPVVGCFRRTVTLDAVPARVPARITADSRYILWINDVEAARGPVRGNLRRLRYDMLDLAPHLRAGANVVAVQAQYFGRPNPWWAPVPPASQLGAGALVFEARLGDDWLVSDAEWRVLIPKAWEDVPALALSAMAPELHDARHLPAQWRAVDFEDGDWRAATELNANSIGFGGRHAPPSHPYGPLPPSPIPQRTATPRPGTVIRVGQCPRAADLSDPFDQVLGDQTASAGGPTEASFPLQLTSAPESAHTVTIDFGQIVVGTVVLDLDAPAGTRIDGAAAEFGSPEGLLTPDDERSGFRYVARGTDDTFETLNPLGLRYLGLSIHAEGPVMLRDVRVHERLYPRRAGPFFECSNARLNTIWAVGRRTVDICSHDAYLDCPTREQRGWTGDFVVHQMVDLTTNPDWRLARWNVEMTASPRPDGMLPMAAGGDFEHFDFGYIPDWALHWIRALYNVYRYTGDRDFIGRLLPVAEGVLRWFVPFQAEDGLLTDVTSWVIIDWSSVTVDGKSSVLNALWGRGLRDFAEMADWLGDAGRAAWARTQAEWVRAAFEAFWDADRGLYIDHIAGGIPGRPYSQHAQASALVATFVPHDRIARVVEVMVDRARYVHATWSRATGDARDPAEGEHGVSGAYLFAGPPEPWWDVEQQMVVAQPYFRYVVHDALAVAGREDLIPEQCLDWRELLERCDTSWSETWYGGTVSHGWCATPTRDLMQRTLGVTPAEPGFGVARIAPRLGPLAWARGAVPTPAGLLAIRATPDHIEIESPVPVDLDLPGRAPVRLPAGAHRFETRPG